MSQAIIDLLKQATYETLYMTFFSAALSGILGIPLGVLLYATKKGNFLDNQKIYLPLGILVNIGRSIPFMVLNAKKSKRKDTIMFSRQKSMSTRLNSFCFLYI